MNNVWTIEEITPENNMARFKKKMQNIFTKYDKPFENSVLVNLETMTYDTPYGPKPWRGDQITYPVQDTAARTGHADLLLAPPHTETMELKAPTAVNGNDQTYGGSNDPEEQDDLKPSTSLKTNVCELTVPAASAMINETFIVSSDKYPDDFKLMIKPMTDKRGCVPLRSMSELEIGKTYSVDLDFLIEDENLPKSYELKVTQEHGESMCLPKKSCGKDASFDCQHAKLNNIESPWNNGTFMFICSPNGKQRPLGDQSEILSQSTGYCEHLELGDKQNFEEIARNSLHAVKEEVNTSQKTITSLGDGYPGFVKRISRSMKIPTSRPSVTTKTTTYKSNGFFCKRTKSNVCRRKATDSTILKSRLKTAAECIMLNTPSNQTWSQRLKHSPHHFYKTYSPTSSTLVVKSNENTCADSVHGESTFPLVERPRTSLVSNGGSKTEWTILKPEFPLKKGTNMGNHPSLEIGEQYEADLSGSPVTSRKVVDKKSQYSYVGFPVAQGCVCKNCLAAAATSNADIQVLDIYCSESEGCLNCKSSQYLAQRAIGKTFESIPFVTQQPNLARNEENNLAGCPMTKQRSKQYCSPCPHEEVKRNKFDLLKMRKVYLNCKKNISKDEKKESAFDQLYRKLCLESNSQVPVLKRTSFSTKNLDLSGKSNALTSSLFCKKVKRNSDFQDDDPVVPNGKRLKSRNVNLNSSEIVNYLFNGVNSPAIEKNPEYLHSGAKWLKKCYTDNPHNKQHPTCFSKTKLSN